VSKRVEKERAGEGEERDAVVDGGERIGVVGRDKGEEMARYESGGGVWYW